MKILYALKAKVVWSMFPSSSETILHLKLYKSLIEAQAASAGWEQRIQSSKNEFFGKPTVLEIQVVDFELEE